MKRRLVREGRQEYLKISQMITVWIVAVNTVNTSNRILDHRGLTRFGNQNGLSPCDDVIGILLRVYLLYLHCEQMEVYTDN